MRNTVSSKFVVVAVGVSMCVGVLLGGYRERTRPAARTSGDWRAARSDEPTNPLPWTEAEAPRVGSVRWRGGVDDGYREVYLPSTPLSESAEPVYEWFRVTDAPGVRAGDRIVRVVVLAEKVNCPAVAYAVLDGARAVPVMHVVGPSR